MNLFTHVKVESRFLPPRVKELNGWQTQDVVEPSLETLKIENRQLIYEVHEYEEVDRVMSGRIVRPIAKHTIPLDYHGEMHFHTYTDMNERVEMVARFNYGELFWVRCQNHYPQDRFVQKNGHKPQ